MSYLAPIVIPDGVGGAKFLEIPEENDSSPMNERKKTVEERAETIMAIFKETFPISGLYVSTGGSGDMQTVNEWIYTTVVRLLREQSASSAVAAREAELREAIEKLRTEVLPTHAEENGYSCALDDILALLPENKSTDL